MEKVKESYLELENSFEYDESIENINIEFMTHRKAPHLIRMDKK